MLGYNLCHKITHMPQTTSQNADHHVLHWYKKLNTSKPDTAQTVLFSGFESPNHNTNAMYLN